MVSLQCYILSTLALLRKRAHFLCSTTPRATFFFQKDGAEKLSRRLPGVGESAVPTSSVGTSTEPLSALQPVVKRGRQPNNPVKRGRGRPRKNREAPPKPPKEPKERKNRKSQRSEKNQKRRAPRREAAAGLGRRTAQKLLSLNQR